MSLTATYKTDEDKSVNGVQIKLSANEDGSIPFFVIARTGRSNKRYTKALERIMRPYQAQVRTKTLGDDLAGELLMQAFIEGSLLTWGNILASDVTADASKEGFTEFSIDAAKQLFTNLPDLYDDLTIQANDVSLFRATVAEESAKN